jgi:PAS domain S-box-containing protein
MIITIILFAFFSIFSKVTFPEYGENIYFERFWVISPILFLTLVFTYIKLNYRVLLNLMYALNVGVILAVFYIGVTSSPTEPGYQYFFAWVMILIIGMFVFYRLPFIQLSIIGALLVITFAFVTWINGTLQQNTFFYETSLFFIVATYSIGFVMAYMFRQINYKEFIHQKVIQANNQILRDQNIERRAAIKALEQSEQQYQNTLDSIPDWIYVVDREAKIVMVNSSLKEGIREAGLEGEPIGSYVTEFFPFMTNKTLDELDRVFKTACMTVVEHNMECNNRMVYIEIRRVPIMQDAVVKQVLTIIRDRSKEREVEELKQRNAEQKEILLREIHHRVKNNLAIVISLLNLQLQKSHDPVFHRTIHDIEMRIRSMALLHEHLYRSENLDRIHLEGYLRSLATIVLSTISGHRVNLHLDLDESESTIETALPIGLIVNELLTNAIKYAFPGQQEGEIYLSLKRTDGPLHTLIVRDNGVGLPKSFSLETENSLGMFIVRLLAEQLDGKIEVTESPGTTFKIRFPIVLVTRDHSKSIS